MTFGSVVRLVVAAVGGTGQSGEGGCLQALQQDEEGGDDRSQPWQGSPRGREGGRIDDDDRRLSPLVHGHLNFLGRYQFSLPSGVRDGELRAALRDPRDAIQEL